MPSKANLEVGIRGNAKHLQKELKKSEAAVKKFSKNSSKQMEKFAAKSKKAIKGLSKVIGGLAIASLGSLTIALNSNAREIDLWSQSLGISSSNLQVWQEAAKRAGVSSDKLTDIFKDINEKTGEALEGTGEMAEVLKLLGINADRLKGRDPGKVLLQIAESVKGLGTQEKTRVFEALGNDLSRLIPFLNQGTQGFNKLKQELTSKGAILDDSTIKKLSKSTEEWEKLKSTLVGFRNTVLNAVAGPVNAAISGMIANFSNLRKNINALTGSAGVKNKLNLVVGADGKARKVDDATLKKYRDNPQGLKSFVPSLASGFGSNKPGHGIFSGAFPKQQGSIMDLAAKRGYGQQQYKIVIEAKDGLKVGGINGTKGYIKEGPIEIITRQTETQVNR